MPKFFFSHSGDLKFYILSMIGIFIPCIFFYGKTNNKTDWNPCSFCGNRFCITFAHKTTSRANNLFLRFFADEWISVFLLLFYFSTVRFFDFRDGIAFSLGNF